MSSAAVDEISKFWLD